MGVSWENVIVGGSSSLTMMYDTLMRGMVFGMLHSPKPWAACPDRKFLCLVPGTTATLPSLRIWGLSW